MRLIDADEMAVNESEAYMKVQTSGMIDEATRIVNTVVHKKIQQLIADTPTVDAVEVVRCADCGMSRETEDEEFVFCMQFRDTVHGQAFCSYGERKDGE